MVIRSIQLTKAKEAKKAKEKAEREGIIIPNKKDEEEKDPMKMTEEELIAKQMEDSKQGNMSEAQKEEQMEREEREKYGRFWIWESYFSDKNK